MQAERIMLEKNENKEYLPMEGLLAFRKATLNLLLGDDNPAVKAVCVHLCSSHCCRTPHTRIHTHTHTHAHCSSMPCVYHNCSPPHYLGTRLHQHIYRVTHQILLGLSLTHKPCAMRLHHTLPESMVPLPAQLCRTQ